MTDGGVAGGANRRMRVEGSCTMVPSRQVIRQLAAQDALRKST